MYIYNYEEYESENEISGISKFLDYHNDYIPEIGPLINEEYTLSYPLLEDKQNNDMNLKKC